MVDHQEHFNRKFYLDKQTGYWISTDYPRIRAHQWVWKCHHTMIPKGYHIHHKNEDKSDNRIENLELIEQSRHLKLHMDDRLKDPIQLQKIKDNCAKIRPMTKAWHASEEGKAWHKLHALKIGFGQNPLRAYICDQCQKSYQSKVPGDNGTRFCSNNCKSAWRRSQKKDIITKKCFQCSKDFDSHKYNKTLCCGRMCAAQMRKNKPINME